MYEHALQKPTKILVGKYEGKMALQRRKCTCKVRPRRGHEGPEGEYMYNSTLSLPSVLDEGDWSTPRPGCFTPGKDSAHIA